MVVLAIAIEFFNQTTFINGSHDTSNHLEGDMSISKGKKTKTKQKNRHTVRKETKTPILTKRTKEQSCSPHSVTFCLSLRYLCRSFQFGHD